MEKRPELTKNISLKDFKEFYWLKEELLDFCRLEKLDKKGGKIELTARIEKYLETGIKEFSKEEKQKSLSQFDWNNEKLTLETLITDNYKNTENVRAFFRDQIGDKFKFNVKFMNWMKKADGKTLKNAVDEWRKISKGFRNDKSQKEIAPQFEYNTYIRDFMNDNPKVAREIVIKCWKIKKSLRGDNKYHRNDLKLIYK